VPLEGVVGEGDDHDHCRRWSREREAREALDERGEERCGEVAGWLELARNFGEEKRGTDVELRNSSVNRKNRARCFEWRTSRSRKAYNFV
jgi:hypothetical protein